MTQISANGIGARLPRTAPLQALHAGLARLAAQVAIWRRRSRDRAALSRMNLRQLDDLPIEWPEDLRHIRRP